MQTLIQDLHYGARMLLKQPGFTLIAVVTLALGIGANTAIFSVVNVALLRPLPFPQAERLVYVWSARQTDPKFEGSLSPLNFMDLRARNQSFEAYCAYSNMIFTLTGDQQPEALNGVMASADFWRVVGLTPALGRVFTAEEDAPGKEQVAVIGDELWRRRFGANPQIIGQRMQLNGEPYTIIGVLPPTSINFPGVNTEVWTPLALDPAKYPARGSGFLGTAARLKPNVTVAQAQTELPNLVERLKAEIPDINQAFAVKVEPVREHLYGELKQPLLILFGAVAFVLLIACVNVANLALARATARWKEIALRSALGASRWSLLRLLLSESLLLAVLGGAAGLLLAAYLVDALIAINPDVINTREKITLDGFVIAFTLATSLLAGVFFGLAPAWQATKVDLQQALRESSRAATGAKRLKLMRHALVVAEVSLSLVLLVGAGLLIKSLWRQLQVNPGFQPENVVMCRIDLPETKYAEAWQQADFFRRTLAELRAQPGITSAGCATGLPFGGSRSTSSFTIEGRPVTRDGSRGPEADRHQAAPGYFEAMGIPLRAGRDFTDADESQHPGVVIINEEAARRFFPGENPLGKRISNGGTQEVKLYGKAVSREIIGIVGNVKHAQLRDDFQPEFYLPAWQVPVSSMMLVVRGSASTEALLSSLRRAVQTVDPEQPLRRAQPLTAAIARSLALPRFMTTLLLLFAALALLLAAVGIYGVMAYAVAQRTQEIGIRLALGARGADVLRLVLRQGLQLTLCGLGLGSLAALALTRLIKSLLFDVSATDPLTFVAIAALLLRIHLKTQPNHKI